MNASPVIPPKLSPFVRSIGGSVTSDDINTYAQFRNITLRTVYGVVLLAAVVAQAVSVNILAFLQGFGVIRLEQWVAVTFVASAFGELTGLAIVIVRYLFPHREVDT